MKTLTMLATVIVMATLAGKGVTGGLDAVTGTLASVSNGIHSVTRDVHAVASDIHSVAKNLSDLIDQTKKKERRLRTPTVTVKTPTTPSTVQVPTTASNPTVPPAAPPPAVTKPLVPVPSTGPTGDVVPGSTDDRQPGATGASGPTGAELGPTPADLGRTGSGAVAPGDVVSGETGG
jgi:hypothetical protein